MKVTYSIEVDYEIEGPIYRMNPDKVMRNGEFNLSKNIDLYELLSDSLDGIEVKTLKIKGELTNE